MARARTRVTGAPGTLRYRKISRRERARARYDCGVVSGCVPRAFVTICQSRPPKQIAIKSRAQDPIWFHRGVLLPYVSERVRATRAHSRLINLSRTRAIDTNIGWAVRLDRRRDIVPSLKLPAVYTFFSRFCFISRPRVVWFSGISDEPEWANCACDIACSQSRRRSGGTDAFRNPHAMLFRLCPRRVILYLAFLSHGRKSLGVQLVCETTNRREMFRRKETYDRIKFVKLIVQLDVLSFKARCRNVTRSRSILSETEFSHAKHYSHRS